MKKTVTSEKTRTRRYIVEAPEPKKGQKVSSGGIRENGKLAAQFKNPVPYEEPTLPVSVKKPRVSKKMNLRNRPSIWLGTVEVRSSFIYGRIILALSSKQKCMN